MPKPSKPLKPITKVLRKSVFQDRLVGEALDTLGKEKGVLVRLGTGLGKSIVAARVARELISSGKILPPPLLPYSAWLIAPKKITPQWSKLLEQFGLAGHVKVTTYGALTGKEGALFVDTDDSGDTPAFTWDLDFLPGFIIIDECQFIRRADALRSKLLRSLPDTTKVMLLSATPYQTVTEARATIELAGTWDGVINHLPATKDNSAHIARSIAFPASPDSLVEASMERLRDYLTRGPSKFLLEAPAARYPQKLNYKVTTFDLTPDQRAWYVDSFKRYLAEKEKAGLSNSMSDRAAAMVAKNKLFEGAEIMSARTLCEKALELKAKGFQVIIAHTHKLTQDRVVFGLIEKFKVPAWTVGAIHGGVSVEDSFKAQELFNEGKLDFLTLAAGAGAEGLNLAHTAEYPSARPRAIVLPTWWSAIKLAQILGRVNRYDSISDSEAYISYPARTVFSEDVLPRVVQRLKCLKAAALARESWMSLIDKAEAETEEGTENSSGDEEATEEAVEGLDGDVVVE